jgi:hypothetical protein
MKKLIAISAASAALILFAVNQSPYEDVEFGPVITAGDAPVIQIDGVAPSNVVTIVTVAKDGAVKTVAYNSYSFGSCAFLENVTTNTVVMRVVTRRWYEPCACPDGIAGCAALHTRLMEEHTYEIVGKNPQEGARYGE